MNIQDCYRILGVAPGSDMERVKTAFRKQAFKLHPDLNPSPDAQQRFQQLNEAYVMLKNALEAEPPPRPGKTRPRPRGPKQPKASAKDGARAYQSQQRADKNGAAGTAGNDRSFYYKKEEVLGDILNDPFARQVFEDIYKHVKRDRAGSAQSRNIERNLKVDFGKRSLSFDLSGGPVAKVKSWLKGQLDDEQTVSFPSHHLIPGRTVRLEISSRFGKPRTVEVRIPADFRIGKPIRLRGLGRRLGPFRGDMLLRIMGK